MASARQEGVNWLKIGALIALAVVTALLAVLALSGARADVPTAGETPGYQPKQNSPETSAPADSETELADSDVNDKEEPAPPIVPALTRLLGVQDDTVAYRTVTGPCPETGFTVETTLDGGASWSVEGDGSSTGLSAPSRILTGTDGYLNVVAQNAADCAQVVVSQSFGFGSFWEPVEGGAAVTWHLSPTDTEAVVVPQVGAVPLPCEGARLASMGAGAASVLCSDTRLITTADSGANWSVSEAFPGAEALASTADTYLIAQTGADGCAGTQVSRVSPGHIVENTVCVGDTPAVSHVALGANSNNVAFLWAGDGLWRSVDGGYTWQ